jgi:hypothetical protein
MTTRFSLLPGFLLIHVLCGSTGFSDTLILQSGRTVKGTVLQRTGGEILLLTDFGTLHFSESSMKEVRIDQAEAGDQSSTNRLPAFRNTILQLNKQPWASNLAQIPATVIDKGILSNVPYLSFRCGDDYEVNIYGDPDHPAGIEAGIYRKLLTDQSAKSNCLQFVSALLGSADRATLLSLNLTKDEKSRDGLTFEITPPEAEDSYQGWWISVYSTELLKRARASDEEMKQISTTKDGASKIGPGSEPGWTPNELKLARPSESIFISFTTPSGDSVTNAQVVRVNEGVSLIWRDGVNGGTVKLADLPEDLRTRFGYDPTLTAAAEAASKQQLARQQSAAQLSADQAAKSVIPSQPTPTASYDTVSAGSSSGGGRVYVRGYTRKNGTYVAPYTRRAPHRR